LKQKYGENVQAYSDRFLGICREMDRGDDCTDTITLDHYLRNVDPRIRREYENYMSFKRLESNNINSSFDSKVEVISLKRVTEICIHYHVIERTSIAVGLNSDMNNRENKSDPKSGTGKKYCSIHKDSHNTSGM